MSASELTLNVTEFKAKCLGIIDQLQDGRLKRVTLTRRGKAVAELSPPAELNKKPYHFDLEEYRAGLGEDRLGYDSTVNTSEPFLDEQSLDEFEAKIERMAEGLWGPKAE